MTSDNHSFQAVVSWHAGNPVSEPVWLSDGDFTTIVAPSAIIGQSVSIVTAFDEQLSVELNEPEQFDGVPLLPAPKALRAGANVFTEDELRALCAAGRVRLVLDAAPIADCTVSLQGSDQG